MDEISLKYGEKKLNFSLGLALLGELIEDSGLDLEGILKRVEDNPLKWLPFTMYCSYKWGCILDKVEIELTFKEFTGLFFEKGGLDTNNSKDFLQAFSNSLSRHAPKEDAPKEKAKPQTKKK